METWYLSEDEIRCQTRDCEDASWRKVRSKILCVQFYIGVLRVI